MIINLIGPPCAGKSYVGSRYVLEHPDWTYDSIDNHRIMAGNEDLAWLGFETSILYKQPIIAESSGLSWRMPKVLETVSRDVYTIALLASRDELHRRLKERHAKRPIPYRLRMDEKQSIDWVLQNIGSCEYPIDLIIRTDEVSKEELYSLISEKIEEMRLRKAKEKMK